MAVLFLSCNFSSWYLFIFIIFFGHEIKIVVVVVVVVYVCSLTSENRRLQSVARSLETTFDKAYKRFNLCAGCFATL